MTEATAGSAAPKAPSGTKPPRPFPFPKPTPDSQPFWDACRAGELRLQRCANGHWRFPPAPLCPECWTHEATWERTRGRGSVIAHVTFRRVYHSAFAPLIPYTVAIVELEEGPRLTTRLVGVGPDEVKGGMPVEVTFEPVGNDVTLPLFTPAK